MRSDGRAAGELRPVRLIPDFTENPLGSVLVKMGRTTVLCTVCEEPSVPRFLLGKGRGWITAEYSMLPGATDRRGEREATRGRPSGRTQEIQRLIGRSLRAVADLSALGERTLWVDCDVLQADGGTRCAAINGAYTALALSVRRLLRRGDLGRDPLRGSVAAVSTGIVGGEVVLDLSYEEDSRAEVDMNVVATDGARFVEVQGTGEGGTFSEGELGELTSLALRGIAQLTEIQSRAVAESAGGSMSGAPPKTYREVVVATSNPGKLVEIRAILADVPLSFRALGAFPEVQLPEEGDSYEENARAKARAVARAAGRPALGDDSGLEVDGLGGAPGPRSARYGGPGLDDAGRTAKLLEALTGLEGDARRARFVCVAALATPDGDLVAVRGECRGRILEAPRGGGGFGYDPVFEVGETGRAMAELPPEEKNRLSHRARAFSALRVSLLDLVG